MPTATRGCGDRTAGGLYLELKTSEHGRPLLDFLLDPPVRIGKEWEKDRGITLSALGVQMFSETLPSGRVVKHIVDVIGKEHYPNLADYLEESSRLGISRKLSSRLNLSGITKESTLIMVHDKAWVGNMYDYPEWHCIKRINIHARGALPTDGFCCSGIWWQDLEPAGTEVIRERLVNRKMPSFSYRAYLRPEGVNPKHERAIFAVFPLAGANMAVIKGEGEDRSRQSAHKSGLPVEECES